MLLVHQEANNSLYPDEKKSQFLINLFTGCDLL